MSRKSKYFKEIERLMDLGWEAKHIVKITGISQPTVSRVTSKLKKEARRDFNNLLSEDYLYKYMFTLENLTKTIRQCNENIEKAEEAYGRLTDIAWQELENIPDSKAHTRVALLQTLSNIKSNYHTTIQKYIDQRDKATDLKAKTYNQGPVVHAIDNWVQKNNPQKGELKTVTEVEDETKPKEKPKELSITKPNEPTEEDLKVLQEMEEEDSKEDKQLNEGEAKNRQ